MRTQRSGRWAVGRVPAPASACILVAVLVLGHVRADSLVATRPATQPKPEPITPLTTAGTGDQVVFRTLGGRQWHRVIHTTQLLAEIEVRTEHAGKMIGLPALRVLRQESDYALDLAESEGADVEVSRESVEAAGRSWDCRLTVARRTSGGAACERRVWMHQDIPVYGVARMELRVDGRMTARLELTEFGYGTATTRPDE